MKSTSDKLFGKEDPVGKVIEIDNAYGKNKFTVTAVVDERLGKTYIHGNLFITMNSGGMGGYTYSNQTWAGNNFAYSFVKLRPGADAAALEKKLPAFLETHGQQQLKDLGMQKQLHLQPIVFHPDYNGI